VWPFVRTILTCIKVSLSESQLDFVITVFCCVKTPDRPPLCSSGQSSWLQIQMSGIGSRRYHIVVGLERGPLSLVSTAEELLERKSSGSGLESREYGIRDQ
jgi:hypothetical protein